MEKILSWISKGSNFFYSLGLLLSIATIALIVKEGELTVTSVAGIAGMALAFATSTQLQLSEVKQT